MPTMLPVAKQRAAAPRQRYGLCKTILMLAVLLIGRGLFAGAMWCADFGSDFTRRH